MSAPLTKRAEALLAEDATDDPPAWGDDMREVMTELLARIAALEAALVASNHEACWPAGAERCEVCDRAECTRSTFAEPWDAASTRTRHLEDLVAGMESTQDAAKLAAEDAARALLAAWTSAMTGGPL